jgi:hypothetical protein
LIVARALTPLSKPLMKLCPIVSGLNLYSQITTVATAVEIEVLLEVALEATAATILVQHPIKAIQNGFTNAFPNS